MPSLRIVLVPVLAVSLAACHIFEDDTGTLTEPAPEASASSSGSAPIIPLRSGQQTLLGFSPGDTKPTSGKPPSPNKPAPAPSASSAPAPAPVHRDDLSEDEAQTFYEGVMLTYAFDACGLPLLGETARQDIGRRIEICPNTEARKSALRTLYQRALKSAQQDPDKLRASALNLCKDKRAFLSNVMSHSQQLRFDDSGPPDCNVISPGP